eukprot:GHVS01059110.1.p1 GENE.GHVS01059110.1~~GHVS01059110.1.p1  ORF type:complete len:298 (+),score=80.99 GHVS01059110.1:42-935(+)
MRNPSSSSSSSFYRCNSPTTPTTTTTTTTTSVVMMLNRIVFSFIFSPLFCVPMLFLFQQHLRCGADESLSDLAVSSSEVLAAATSAESLSSPFTTDGGRGGGQQEKEEAWLDNVDAKLKDFERQQRMVMCFDFTQRHYTRHRELYIQQARSSSTKLQMREDEAMRLMFHGSLVSCYHNIREKDVDLHSRDRLTPEDERRILTRHKHTPLRFSAQQMRLLETIVSSTQDGSTPGFMTISGRMGYLYALVVVLLLSGGLAYGYHKLVAIRELRAGGRKGAKISARIEKKAMQAKKMRYE